MERLTGNARWKRILASVLAVLLVLSMQSEALSTVRAEITAQPGGVTVLVTDEEGKPLEGAEVSYTIEATGTVSGGSVSGSSVSGGSVSGGSVSGGSVSGGSVSGDPTQSGESFTPVTGSGLTDENGIIRVLEEGAYISGCLTITATIAMENYKTDRVTLVKKEISAASQCFPVVMQLLPELEGVTVEVLDAAYNAAEQKLVSVSVRTEDVKIEYSMDNVAWSEDVPERKGVAEYPVYVKVSKTGYQTFLSGEKTARICKAQQHLKFKGAYEDQTSGTVQITLAELESGKSFDFSAVDADALTEGTTISGEQISYSLDFDGTDDGIAELDNQTGMLTVTGAGKVKVKAFIPGNMAYESATIDYTLYISAQGNGRKFLSFEKPEIEYIVGNVNGISRNIAIPANRFDRGIITYSMENTEVGGILSVNADNGEITVRNYKKLLQTIEADGGVLSITVKATKTAVSDAAGVYYPEDTDTYTLRIRLADIPETPYTVFGAADPDEELTAGNGDNGWYRSAVVVKPAEGWQIIRADTLTEEAPFFGESVKFGEMTDGIAEDQGISADRSIYLKNTTTGEITGRIVTVVEKLDTVKPYDLEILFPECEEKDGVRYYGDEITVTFIARDATSGVAKFDWGYVKTDDAFCLPAEISGSVAAVQDVSDPAGTKYVGSLTLPANAAEQLKGNLRITAQDVAGNRSDAYTEQGVFVVDTVSPVQTVSYRLKNGEGSTQTVDGRHYFSGDVEFTFVIKEANFFSEDVEIMLSKDGAAAQRQNPVWTAAEEQDVFKANLYLTEEGDYTVTMKYTDRSGQEMSSYTSETIIIDRTKPVIEFEYRDYMDETAPQTATIRITEHNFRASDIEVVTTATDITGAAVPDSELEQYLESCEWTDNGDVHTAVISSRFADALYRLTISYKDLALNAADGVTTDLFVVDRTAPETEEMSIQYSDPLLETILSAVTFGFYNPQVTVSFTAHDETSGVDYFLWNYERQDGASSVNAEAYSEMLLNAVQDAEDTTKYTATMTLPKAEAEQLRGSLSFTATDKCGNTSNLLSDDRHMLVVDTIAPTMEVAYSAGDNSQGEKVYYSRDFTATFTVTEANFYPEDVRVMLKKDEREAVEIVPEWTETSGDVHIGTYTVNAAADHANDGDYVFVVEYRDRSNNEMSTYTSGIKVVDTTVPVIRVDYANKSPVNSLLDSEGNVRKYFASANAATVTVLEHNFNAADVVLKIDAKDVAGNVLGGTLYTMSDWSSDGDTHVLTITYPGSANYTFDIEYTDLAKLNAADYSQDYFTVDTDVPTNLSVSYSMGITEVILANITFGFYNAKATVTVQARDQISGLHSIRYGYLNAEDVSTVNAEMADQVIEADGISFSENGVMGTASFEIPQSVLTANAQFNGNISFEATDRAGNISDKQQDSKRLVVDNIAPTATVEYNQPVREAADVAYYDGDIQALITVNEANFYAEDVALTVTRDGNPVAVVPMWSDNSPDVHTGVFTLSEEGDYQISIGYTDRSGNAMQQYTSGQLTIDRGIEEDAITVTINGEEADEKAFPKEVILEISFTDRNFEAYEVELYRTRMAEKRVRVTEEFIAGHISTDAEGGSGMMDTFEIRPENDGIYTLEITLEDKAGHTAEKTVTFTINRYGSVYEYSDYLAMLVRDGGAYVQSVEENLIITEYNPDRLISDSLSIEIARDGKPIETATDQIEVSPEINQTAEVGSSGWYQYQYTISKDIFFVDGVYKLAVSSKDATGNSPENTNYENMDILFRVDKTPPEIASISGLEKSVINDTRQEVSFVVYDTIGLKSVQVYVGGIEEKSVTDFGEDGNNYSGSFVIKESTETQTVRIVVTDLAGNITDTDTEDFESSYVFNGRVTVSTNIFVRWFANKLLFYGSLGGSTAAVTAAGASILFFRRRKLIKSSS